MATPGHRRPQRVRRAKETAPFPTVPVLDPEFRINTMRTCDAWW